MNIAIDISQIVYQGTGVGRFTNGLVNAILDYDNKNHWIFFFSGLRKQLEPHLEKKIMDYGHQLIKWKLPPTLLSFLWNDLHFSFLPPTFYHLPPKLDFFITSDWTEPAMPGIKKATIVHDLVFKRYPETVDNKILKTQERRLSWVKKESKLIFADSQTTKNDLVELLNIPNNKIVVNYPGVEIEKPDLNKKQDFLKKYRLTKPFILSVGKLEPRKNLNRLISAMKQLNNQTIDLVIAGQKGWQSFDFAQDKQFNNVKFIGYLPDNELSLLYSSCLFFVYPSIWEGFGYPIVEAMKLGVPVACSNTSSMKEIADDSALMFNPLDEDNMYQSIDRLIQDQVLRKQLIKKGVEKSKIFTWKAYLQTMLYNLDKNI
jgi:glycosyltransferase involved in cell wall biosynthesis